MADARKDLEQLEDLVKRYVRRELQKGGLDRLLDVERIVRESLTFNLRVEPRLSFDAGAPRQVIRPEGIPSAEAFGEPVVEVKSRVLAAPTMTAVASMPVPEVTVIPDKVIDAIGSASPELADEIQAHSYDQAILILTILGIVLAALQTAMQAYQFFNPQTPTPSQTVQIFNQIYNVVNPPAGPASPPPAPGGPGQ